MHSYRPAVIVAAGAAAMFVLVATATSDAAFVGGFILGVILAGVAVIQTVDVHVRRRHHRNTRLSDRTVDRLTQGDPQ